MSGNLTGASGAKCQVSTLQLMYDSDVNRSGVSINRTIPAANDNFPKLIRMNFFPFYLKIDSFTSEPHTSVTASSLHSYCVSGSLWPYHSHYSYNKWLPTFGSKSSWHPSGTLGREYWFRIYHLVTIAQLLNGTLHDTTSAKNEIKWTCSLNPTEPLSTTEYLLS